MEFFVAGGVASVEFVLILEGDRSMQGINKILVGIDAGAAVQGGADARLSRANREAVDRALWLAEMNRGEVTFFSALDVEVPRVDEKLEGTAAASAVEHARSLLRSLEEEAAARGVAAQTNLVSGRAWLEMIREVLRSGHQIVIVGTREHWRPQQLLFGSMAMKLLRKCPCPVWVTRPPQNGPPEQRTVLVADDFTDVGQRALHLAVSAAQMMQARLLALHAVEHTLAPMLYRSGIPDEELDAYRHKCRTDAEQELRERLAITDYRAVEAGTQVQITFGPADTVIEEAIEEHDADLLVMGTLGLGGIPGLLLGNTAERLLPLVRCSVLAIKPRDFVSPVTLT